MKEYTLKLIKNSTLLFKSTEMPFKISTGTLAYPHWSKNKKVFPPPLG